MSAKIFKALIVSRWKEKNQMNHSTRYQVKAFVVVKYAIQKLLRKVIDIKAEKFYVSNYNTITH